MSSIREMEEALRDACMRGDLHTVQRLVAQGVNVECRDFLQQTPLHYASWRGRTAVVKYLLAEVKCDPNCTTKSGETPLDATNKTAIIRELILHGADSKNAYAKCSSKLLPEHCHKKPVEAAVNTFVLGNVGAGKSTLTKALSKDYKGISRVAARLTKVSGVQEKTAGIIPHRLESDKLGRVTLYDFAGHREFYSSHESLLHNAMRGSSGAVFLLLADLSKSDEEFRDTLLYWLSFLDNQCSSTDTTSNEADLTNSKPLSSHDTNPKAHIIIVGSHADHTKPSAEKKGIVSSLKSTYTTFHFAGFVAIDCRFAESSAMTELRQCLAQSCTSLRHSTFVSFRSHCFLIYLLDKFRDSPAVSLDKVSTTVHSDSRKAKVGLLSFIPDGLSGLCSSCDELNARGNLLFIKSSSNIRDSWLILDRETLLTEVTGTVFAPAAFKQHRDLASSTGVVPLSKIAFHFPSLNPHMVADFLCHLEFCHEVSDHEVLKLLQEPATSASEKYYFSPALVSIDAPALWDADASYTHHSAWLLQCTHAREFFTPRFLQVLLLRLAFGFALASDNQEGSSELPALQRKCTVWKNGIYWCNRHGAEALVEVGEDSRKAVVMVRCQKGSEMACVYLRSMILQAVQLALAEFCPKVSTSESFVHPDDASCYPLQLKHKPFSMAEVAGAIVEGAPFVVPSDGRALDLDKLLQFEPYAQLQEDILHMLHGETPPDYERETIDRTCKCILDSIQEKMKPAARRLKPAAAVMKHLTDKSTNPNHRSIREQLDQFSMFAGRNILKLAGHRSPSVGVPLTSSVMRKTAEIPEKAYEPQGLKLKEEDLVILLDLLKDAAAQWREIGLQLLFTGGELDIIEQSPVLIVQGPSGYLRKLLSQWLKWAPPAHVWPTIEALASALRRSGEEALAFNLREKFEDKKKLAGHKSSTKVVPVDNSVMRKTAAIPIKSGMPRLYELQRLRGRDGSTVRVITTIAHQWETIAYALHFGHEEVAAIRRDMAHGVEAACEEVLGRWLSGKHLTPVTWESLLEALRDCNFTTLARDLEDILLR